MNPTNRKTRSFSRRTVVRGMGATLALPWLDVMGGKTVAATASQKEPPRFACFYIPGCIGSHAWFPMETGRGFTLPQSMTPLNGHRDDFSVLTNLSHIEGRISGHWLPFSWLTGHNINLTPGTLTNSVSVDQVAAQYLGPTYLPSLVVSYRDGVGGSTLSRNALGVDIPATANYRTVFDRLFPPADKEQLAEARKRVALNKSILDTALGSVHDFRKDLGVDDQKRMDQYLAAIRDVEKRLTERDSILKNGRPVFDENGVRLAPPSKNSMGDHVELMMDLIVLAFQTDMTRVVTHMLGGEGGPNYDEYKTWAKVAGAKSRGAHDYHHKGGQARSIDDPDAKVINARDQLFCGKLARLMDRLKGIEAQQGTLLDHTVLLFGGCQTRSHSGKSFPTMLAGGKALGFKHGQHLKWKSDERPMSDLYLTILQQLGCPVTSFKESKAPIRELLA